MNLNTVLMVRSVPMNSHQTSSGRLGEMNSVKIWIFKALYSIHDLI